MSKPLSLGHLFAAVVIASTAVALNAQSSDPLVPDNPAREHIYIGGRLVAIETLPDGPNVPPTVDWVNPASGSGSNQVFTFRYSDADGYDDILFAHVIIRQTLSGTNSCYSYYHQGQGAFYLRNDANTGWHGPLTPGTSQTVENSQCRINGLGTTVSGQGSELTTQLDLTFMGSYSGTKTIWGNVRDYAGPAVGWKTLGTWTVP